MNYKRSIFSFLDVLGFRELVRTGTPEKIGRLLDVLRRATTPDDFSAMCWEISFVTFSDCTIRAVPIEDTDDTGMCQKIVSHELLMLSLAQWELIQAGYFLRGSVTIGDIFFAGSTVFGPALVQGYTLESEFAVYPRIVIDPAVFELLDSDLLVKDEQHDPTKQAFRRLIRCDSDGIYFIDYLSDIVHQFRKAGEDEFALARLWEHKHKILTCCRAYGCLSKIAAKYLWLATYHNTVVRDFGHEQYVKLGKEIDKYLIRNDEFPLVVAS